MTDHVLMKLGVLDDLLHALDEAGIAYTILMKSPQSQIMKRWDVVLITTNIMLVIV